MDSHRKVGSVIYQKNPKTGELTAQWNFRQGDNLHWGTGSATGPQGPSFSGEYEIFYHSKGDTQGPFLLHISEEEGQILLEWYQDTQLVNQGIGMIHRGSLVAGWIDLPEES